MIARGFLRIAIVLVALLLLAGHSAAHVDLSPDELVKYHANVKRDSDALYQCLQSPEMHEYNTRMVAHREQTLHRLRQARNLATRDRPSADKWIDVNHEDKPGHSRGHPSMFNYREGEDPKFNSTGCALTPTSLYGPYWLEGQPQRQDVKGGQRGIYFRLALQIIDVSRCLPLHGAQVDIWHANSMGEYSREAGGYLRGWQPTDRYGAVDFDTNFPGHYTDRASHIHVVVRAVNEKRVVHFGQIYFDQKIRDDVEATDRYKDNKQSLLSNTEDGWIPADSSAQADPFVHWSRIGNSLEDGGLLGWITLGVDATNLKMEQPPNEKRNVIDWHFD